MLCTFVDPYFSHSFDSLSLDPDLDWLLPVFTDRLQYSLGPQKGVHHLSEKNLCRWASLSVATLDCLQLALHQTECLAQSANFFSPLRVKSLLRRQPLPDFIELLGEGLRLGFVGQCFFQLCFEVFHKK